MNTTIAKPILSILLLLFTLSVRAAPPKSLEVGGAVKKPGIWTMERLRKEFAANIRLITYRQNGVRHTAHCIPLLAFLEAAQPVPTPNIKHSEMLLTVRVTGRDGYAVCLSYGELLPLFGNRAVYLVLDEDGHALPEKQGPARLIVPDDKKYARWVFALDNIEILNNDRTREK